MASTRAGSVIRHTVWVDAIGLEVGQRRLVDREQGGEPVGRREAPHGRQVRRGGPQQVEPVALGLRRGELVREDAPFARPAQLERADDAGRAAHDALVVGRLHPVHGEGRLGVVDQHAEAAPLGEQLGGGGVRVGVGPGGIGDREVDAHDVLGRPADEGLAVVGADDVVRRRGDVDRVELVEVVPDPTEGLEAGHGTVLPGPPGALRWPGVAVGAVEVAISRAPAGRRAATRR